MNSLLAYIQFIFIGLVIYGSVLTFSDTSINTSISGIVAPILAWFAGTGLRASFNSDNNQTKGSIFMAVILLSYQAIYGLTQQAIGTLLTQLKFQEKTY